MVGLSTLLLILGSFRIDNIWSLFREGSCAPSIFQFPNRVWNWNFSFDKRWWSVRWSCYCCVFRKLKSNFWCTQNWKMKSAVTVTCKENLFVKVSNRQYHPLSYLLTWGAKNLACCLVTFQSGILMNELKFQIGVALILKCFWWIFVPAEAKFHFNTNTKTLLLHTWSKSIKTS